MADINIHNVVNIEVDKYQLEGNTYICKIHIDSETRIGKIQSSEILTLFSDDNKVFRNFK